MVMLWAQLTHRDSPRDIEAGLRAHGEKLYRLGMGKSVNKSTMSYANTNKEVAVFRELAQKMMELASRAAGVKNGELGKLAGVLELAGVFAVDSSTVNLDLKRFGWSVPQEGMGGIKLHTMYDVMREVPALCLVTGHEERDQTFMDDYPYMKGGLYVFDRAYVKTQSLKRIDDGGAYFIVRRKKAWSTGACPIPEANACRSMGTRESSSPTDGRGKGIPANCVWCNITARRGTR